MPNIDVERAVVSPQTQNLLRFRAEKLGLRAYAMTYLQPIHKELCHGIVATDNGIDCFISTKPSLSYNGVIVSQIDQWQKESFGEFLAVDQPHPHKRKTLIAENMFYSAGLRIAGRSLLDCKADQYKTDLILAGLAELRARIRNGWPPGGELINLRDLLDGADCLMAGQAA